MSDISTLASAASGTDPKSGLRLPAGKSNVEELKQAVTYVKQLKTPEAAGPLLEAFLKVKPSDPKSGPAYLPVKDAMLVLVDPSWKPKLIDVLNRPVNTKEVQEGRNDVYWQTVSAEVLGEMGPAAADATKIDTVLTFDRDFQAYRTRRGHALTCPLLADEI